MDTGNSVMKTWVGAVRPRSSQWGTKRDKYNTSNNKDVGLKKKRDGKKYGKY